MSLFGLQRAPSLSDQVTDKWHCLTCGYLSQVGRQGHCSVEDARAALDLYKLVEGEWEQQLHAMLSDQEVPPSAATSSHYMQDEYWPSDVINADQWDDGADLSSLTPDQHIVSLPLNSNL